MSGADTRIPRPEAVAAAKRFVDLLDGTYSQLVVAGSLRRRLALIGDVEVVAVPRVESVESEDVDLFGTRRPAEDVDLLDRRMQMLLEEGTVSKRLDSAGSPRWGPMVKFALFEGVRVDLFTPSEDRFGWILLLRTGSAMFSRQLVVPKGKQTRDGRPGLLPRHLQPRDGYLTYRTSGERIPTPTEREVFDLFGLPVREPWERI